MGKVALITGITGQDGSYLAELLMEKGYEVHGVVRWKSSIDSRHIDHLYDELKERLYYCDMTDAGAVTDVISRVKPDEIYNLAAQSHVGTSFKNPSLTLMTNVMGLQNIINAVLVLGLGKSCRIYQASTSEMYGNSVEEGGFQNEKTAFAPTSPYACAKLAAHFLVDTYRKGYGMFICSGILFNHESPRRDPRFVTRKITQGVARYSRSPDTFRPIELGNLCAQRDWGFAGDYVRGMWMMLQQEKPVDYVLATGIPRSVRELVEKAFLLRGVVVVWEGKGVEEIGKDRASGRVLVRVCERYFRPSEVDFLSGDSSKARSELGWKPKVSFEEMLEKMITFDE